MRKLHLLLLRQLRFSVGSSPVAAVAVQHRLDKELARVQGRRSTGHRIMQQLHPLRHALGTCVQSVADVDRGSTAYMQQFSPTYNQADESPAPIP